MRPWICVLAPVLCLRIAGTAKAQAPLESTYRPILGVSVGLAVGGDVRDKNGTQLHGGLFLQNSHWRFFTSVIEASAWMTLVTCANEPFGCAGGGWRTAARLNLSPFETSGSVIRPYVGGGIGMTAIRSTRFASHYRFGLAFGRADGPVADLGLTTDLLSGARERSLRVLTFGVGWRVGGA